MIWKKKGNELKQKFNQDYNNFNEIIEKKKNESNKLFQTINDYNKIIENQKKFKEERKISENYKQNIENVKIKISQLLNEKLTKYLIKTEDNFLNQIKDKNIEKINKCKNEINNLEEKRNLEFQEKKKKNMKKLNHHYLMNVKKI